MLFTTVGFIIFMAIAAVGYYVLPQRWRNVYLLIASYIFYMWKLPEYGVLVLFSTAVSYASGRLIDREQDESRRRLYMTLGIVLNLAVLFVFKYYNFFMETVSALAGAMGVTVGAGKLTLALPAGISFYTFQVIGYMVDVKQRRVESEKSFITYALFVSFFPQILSGPIGRAKELLPQYREKHEFCYGTVVEGMQRFLTGAFKKVVVADGLGIIVGGIYGNLPEYKGLTLIAAVLLFAMQIYCDFSGYSDMAVGVGRILGFTLRENFNAPFFATSIGGIWQRWHMSLTTWLNDYIFTPLVWSGWWNRVFHRKDWEERAPQFTANIIIVFAISGLWHGASVTYLVWGLVNGVARSIEELLERYRKRHRRKTGKRREPTVLGAAAGHVWVYLYWAATHVFFRAATMSDALYIFRSSFTDWSPSVTLRQIAFLATNGISASGYYNLIFWGGLMFGVVAVFLMDRSIYLRSRSGVTCVNPLSLLPKIPRWLAYWSMGLLTAAFYLISLTGTSSAGQFIYFNY